MKSIKYYVLCIMGILLLYIIPVAYAANPCPGPSGGVQIGDCFGFGEIKSLGQGTSQLVGPMFSVAAVLVIIYFLFGAFKYLKAGGSKEEIEAARNMIVHAIFGFLILMLAFLVLQFLLSSLFGIQFKIIG